jgi:hypothetical protein
MARYVTLAAPTEPPVRSTFNVSFAERILKVADTENGPAESGHEIALLAQLAHQLFVIEQEADIEGSPLFDNLQYTHRSLIVFVFRN